MLDLLVTTLRQASVEFLVLKGMPLAHRFYGRVDLRATRDLDILVRRSDIDVCLHVLRPLGFKYKDRRRNPISRYRIRTEHAASLIHGETELDLHWRLRNNAVHRIGEASLWEEADDHQWESGDCRVLSPHHELLLLLLSAAHDIERGACRIKHLLDTYVLVRRIHDELDWKQYLHDRAVEITLGECLNVLGLVLILLARPGEFVELRRALDDHRDRIVCRDRADAIALVSAKRGSVANQRWFAKVSPAWHWRSLVRTLDRNVLRPGRIPWLMIKTARHLFAPASEPRR